MDLNQALGQVVRMARVQAGLNQHQFAEKVGLHWTHVGKLERGERDPRFATLKQLSAGLKMPLSELIRQAEKLQRIGSDSKRAPH